MAEIHHLEHGWVTPTISYVLSVLGSLLGLICAVRLRSAPSTGWRAWWLGLAAVAIGGTGIWTMHFVAMLGFSVVGTPIRYDVPTTAISAVIAVTAVGVGLAIVSLGTRARRTRIVVGGVLTGLGVAAMHYTGMFAMRLDGEISYADTRVGASLAIAVVAATVALWLAVTVRGTPAIVVSALIMGVAVNGMHFTGMSAMSVQAGTSTVTPAGATATTLLIPIGVAVLFGVLGLLYALMAAPTDEDRAALAYLEARRAGKPVAPDAAVAPGTEADPAPPAASESPRFGGHGHRATGGSVFQDPAGGPAFRGLGDAGVRGARATGPADVPVFRGASDAGPGFRGGAGEAGPGFRGAGGEAGSLSRGGVGDAGPGFRGAGGEAGPPFRGDAGEAGPGFRGAGSAGETGSGFRGVSRAGEAGPGFGGMSGAGQAGPGFRGMHGAGQVGSGFGGAGGAGQAAPGVRAADGSGGDAVPPAVAGYPAANAGPGYPGAPSAPGAGADPAAQPPGPDPAVPPGVVPGQRQPRRMPSVGSRWTNRERPGR
ncbi:MHYT domain-containing protein [Jidongwangia harbinensis]|uniref:MHYT domain-containing protein n=1 Tax=Jidongwangia harbinensis TaxID=2878561 RepID=UPI001CD9F1F5|nr:MHYT domain-containing protein [Jidongwangia harbinensis]MCA2217920.1 hypothetical protein [Jidongwangia harbinensis]